MVTSFNLKRDVQNVHDKLALAYAISRKNAMSPLKLFNISDILDKPLLLTLPIGEL